MSILSFVWGGAKPNWSEWSPAWMSYICAKLCQSQDDKTGRVEESRAEKPRFDTFCLFNHYPNQSIPEKQRRHLQRAHELINNPCQRWPGLYRVVLDICCHDYICQQAGRAACRELTVAGPWGVKKQFITLITKLCISNSAKHRQCMLPSAVRHVPLCWCFLVYRGCTLFYPVKHFWIWVMGKTAIKMYSFRLLMICPAQGSELFLMEACVMGPFHMCFLAICWWQYSFPQMYSIPENLYWISELLRLRSQQSFH